MVCKVLYTLTLPKQQTQATHSVVGDLIHYIMRSGEEMGEWRKGEWNWGIGREREDEIRE